MQCSAAAEEEEADELCRRRRVEDDQISHPTSLPPSLFLPPSEIGFSYLRSLSLGGRGEREDLLSRKQSEIKTADKSDVVEVEIARAGA